MFLPGCGGASKTRLPCLARRASFLGDVQVQAVHVITGIVEDKAADFVAVESRPGVRIPRSIQASTSCSLTPLLHSKDARSLLSLTGNEASLVLIHGTFSQTPGTFGKLWTEHPQLVDQLFKSFRNRVYALDHPTLGASPIANAITLAEAAPKGARLHLLTHSRGGLVAEVLARVCANPTPS